MKRVMRYILWTAAVVVVVVVGVAGYLLVTTGGKGTSGLEEWIGGQVKGVAQQYLKVRLDFERPDYRYPKTVVLNNVRLSAADPANPGRTIDVAAIGRATMTLGEIPEAGKPLHIEEVILEEPVLRLVATGEGMASFIGWSDLIKGGGEEVPKTEPVKVTDVFRIRRIELREGRVVYDPRQADRRAMDLDRINCRLDVQPDEVGWYKLAASLGQEPVGSLAMSGRFNINESLLELAKVEVKATLGAETNRALPPQLQTVLAEHDVRGRLTMKGAGVLRLNDVAASKGSVNLELDGGSLSVGEYFFAVAACSIDTTVADGVINLARLDMRALGGTLNATGTLALRGAGEGTLRLRGKDLRMERLLTSVAAESEPAGEGGGAVAAGAGAATVATARQGSEKALPFAGKVEVEVDARAPLRQVQAQLFGKGRILVTEGTISRLPVISQIENALDAASKVVMGQRSAAQNESALVEFDLNGDHADLTTIDYRSTLIAVRGVGTVGFAAGKLNLLLNGGPIEKLQSLLGPIGDITGVVTDALMGYKVTGTVEDPKVEVVVASGIFDDISNFLQGK